MVALHLHCSSKNVVRGCVETNDRSAVKILTIVSGRQPDLLRPPRSLPILQRSRTPRSRSSIWPAATTCSRSGSASVRLSEKDRCVTLRADFSPLRFAISVPCTSLKRANRARSTGPAREPVVAAMSSAPRGDPHHHQRPDRQARALTGARQIRARRSRPSPARGLRNIHDRDPQAEPYARELGRDHPARRPRPQRIEGLEVWPAGCLLFEHAIDPLKDRR